MGLPHSAAALDHPTSAAGAVLRAKQAGITQRRVGVLTHDPLGAGALTGQYGIDDLYVGVPCVIGAGGVEQVIEIALDDKARAGLQVSIDAVKELVAACKGIDGSLE